MASFARIAAFLVGALLSVLSPASAHQVRGRDPIHYKNLFYYSPLPVTLARTHGPGRAIPPRLDKHAG